MWKYSFRISSFEDLFVAIKCSFSGKYTKPDEAISQKKKNKKIIFWKTNKNNGHRLTNIIIELEIYYIVLLPKENMGLSYIGPSDKLNKNKSKEMIKLHVYTLVSTIQKKKKKKNKCDTSFHNYTSSYQNLK